MSSDRPPPPGAAGRGGRDDEFSLLNPRLARLLLTCRMRSSTTSSCKHSQRSSYRRRRSERWKPRHSPASTPRTLLALLPMLPMLRPHRRRQTNRSHFRSGQTRESCRHLHRCLPCSGDPSTATTGAPSRRCPTRTAWAPSPHAFACSRPRAQSPPLPRSIQMGRQLRPARCAMTMAMKLSSRPSARLTERSLRRELFGAFICHPRLALLRLCLSRPTRMASLRHRRNFRRPPLQNQQHHLKACFPKYGSMSHGDERSQRCRQANHFLAFFC
ncbi:hypothetical protein, variant [Capsaspora owczarzaki ATCC 30864]|uniref:Uncharacterized protein n=1 Tax=Capsaspora owczarzaki (strain ATCC 30864) TaxID=595528 RepID=A0A0D2WQS9_CAPO3|nr:hypothetical protein, variant [Capsaspora owczarzaki ATCC 30864]